MENGATGDVHMDRMVRGSTCLFFRKIPKVKNNKDIVKLLIANYKENKTVAFFNKINPTLKIELPEIPTKTLRNIPRNGIHWNTQ